MDVNSTLRVCPICRKLSYFVIPSVIWYSTSGEKQEIIDRMTATRQNSSQLIASILTLGMGTALLELAVSTSMHLEMAILSR